MLILLVFSIIIIFCVLVGMMYHNYEAEIKCLKRDCEKYEREVRKLEKELNDKKTS